jgi:hypothetical protein
MALDWTGGMYATPAFSGSRVGGIIAATWWVSRLPLGAAVTERTWRRAALVYQGEERYVECAR